MLLRAAERYDDIMAVMLPTLGEERQATYSPFLPISPNTGRVLYVPMKHVDAKAGTITFDDEDGEETTLPVTGGHVKLQWKPDFGMRWAALGVDFEMFGKDHQTNAADLRPDLQDPRRPSRRSISSTSSSSTRTARRSPSRRATASTIEQWLTYAPTESLALHVPEVRGRRRSSISTSSRRPSTSTSPSSTHTEQTPSSSSKIRPGTSMPAIRRRIARRSPSPCC